MTQDYVNFQKQLLGAIWQKCPLIKLNKQIVEGKKASQAVCEYVDWLLSTYNPNPPDKGSCIKPSIHPCQSQHKDIVIMRQSDDHYVDLLDMVQRHTCCSTNYCLSKKQDEADLRCRFHFSFQPCASIKLEFEPIHTKNGNAKYKAKIVGSIINNRLEGKL